MESCGNCQEMITGSALMERGEKDERRVEILGEVLAMPIYATGRNGATSRMRQNRKADSATDGCRTVLPHRRREVERRRG
jgi:hypothetical protein